MKNLKKIVFSTLFAALSFTGVMSTTQAAPRCTLHIGIHEFFSKGTVRYVSQILAERDYVIAEASQGADFEMLLDIWYDPNHGREGKLGYTRFRMNDFRSGKETSLIDHKIDAPNGSDYRNADARAMLNALIPECASL